MEFCTDFFHIDACSGESQSTESSSTHRFKQSKTRGECTNLKPDRPQRGSCCSSTTYAHRPQQPCPGGVETRSSTSRHKRWSYSLDATATPQFLRAGGPQSAQQRAARLISSVTTHVRKDKATAAGEILRAAAMTPTMTTTTATHIRMQSLTTPSHLPPS